MLTDILKENKCLKLVCGAGNQNLSEIEKLVALYSVAGCNFFDLSADINVINAAKKGLEYSKITKDRYLCVSVGVKDDIHLMKAEINNCRCKNCGKCAKICPQNAIFKVDNLYHINKQNCIGCKKCYSTCSNNAISFQATNSDFKELLPDIINNGVDCIEFHISAENTEEIFQKWNDLNDLFDGILSICVDRTNFGNKKLIKILNTLLKDRKPFTTIIQADGSPMSGGKDDFNSTLQTVATADIIDKSEMKVYTLLSGGTNSKSSELAKLCNIPFNGVSIGSFARKIVKEYIDREDFLQNEKAFNEALVIAKKLIDDLLNYM